VGYIRIDYCKRDLAEVFQDVTKYSSWADGVQGIFLDETPNLYTASVASYLDGVDRFVKDTVGILGSRLVSNFNS
jgi:Spherulation-specific family 4